MGARSFIFMCAAFLVPACSCGEDAPNNPSPGAACELEMPLEGCGNECGAPGAGACPAGLYCGSGDTCTADCVPSGSPSCDTGYRCTSTGQCEEDPTARRDAGDPNVCADVRLEGVRVTPTVIVIVDQSGSMTSDFGGGDRWNVLRDSLLDDMGLIRDLEGSVRFGLAMYSARAENDDEPAMGECPIITSVPPALNNYDAIAGIYNPADPIDETPTGEAIERVLADYLSIPDPDPDPAIFILATDGEPDTCAEPNPQNGQATAIAAVEHAYSEGVRTYAISVGRDVGMRHLQDIANAGLGRGAGDPDAPFWVAGDDAGLRDALRMIVGGVLSCTIDLRGNIDTSMACSGTVRLNGMVIPCDDDNGWRVVDENTIELQGDACDTLQDGPGATLEATFPCDVILI